MQKLNMTFIALLAGAKAVKIQPTIQSQYLSQLELEAEFWDWTAQRFLDEAVGWVSDTANNVGNWVG